MSYCSIYGTSSFCVYRSSMFSSTMLWWKTFWGERPRCPPPSCTVTSTASSRPTQQAARSWRSSSGWEIKDTSGISQATRIGVDSDPFHFRRFNLLVLHCCSLMVILSSFHIYIYIYIRLFASSHQLLTQCNLRFVECFSAHKDSNKEKNRNSSVVPCEYHCFKHSMIPVSSSCWLIFLHFEIQSNKSQTLKCSTRSLLHFHAFSLYTVHPKLEYISIIL